MAFTRVRITILCLLIIPAGAMAQNLKSADSLRAKGERFQERGNFKKAEFYYHAAYNLYKTEHDTASLLITGVYYGEVLSYRSKMDEAITLLNYVKSISHPANDDSLKSRIESDLGWTYKQKGKPKKALPHLRQSLSYARQAKDSLMLGVSLNNIASAYSNQHNTQKAIQFYKRALVIFDKLDNTRSNAYTLSNLGDIYKRLAMYDKAFEYYSRSLEITKQIDNVNMRASIYYKLGGLQQELGHYDQALVALQKALKYCRQANNIQKVGSALNQIGTLYGTLGEREKALRYYRESLLVWKKVSNPSQLAIANKNIAYSLWHLGRKKEAIEKFKEALMLKKEAGDPRAIATSLLDLAMIENSQHDVAAASRYVHQVWAIADSTGDQYLLRKTSEWLGILESARGNFSKAITHYKKALHYSRSFSESAQLNPLMNLASTFNLLKSDSTLYYGQQAVDIIEKNRLQVGALSKIKSGYFSQYSNFYVDMASWVLKYRHDDSRAFALVESSKARSLRDELAEAAKRIDESLPEEDRLKRARQRADISALYSQLKQTTNQAKVTQLKYKIRDKELAQASFENHLHQKYSQYKNLKNPTLVSLLQAQKMCDSETAILEYAVTDKKLIAFFITREKVSTHEFSLSPSPSADKQSLLARQVLQFRKAILAMAPEDSLRRLSKPLYDQLVRPFQKGLASHKNVVIVPSGFLAYLPFEALSNDDNNYLVSQFNIKYIPSVTGFSLIPKPKPDAPQKLLAIANASANAGYSNAPFLPTADLEIDLVSSLFSTKTVLRNENVTEEKVKKSIQDDYSYIHIAAHSMINEKNSSLSGIILDQNPDDKSVDNDGYLRSNEIYRLNVRSNMVVLSACKSGIGRVVSGEGMLGLERAFFSAGTSTVVVSLWDVYDRSTTHFMQQFYKNLFNGPGNSWAHSWESFLRWTGWDQSVPFGRRAVAMRDAKLQMLNSPQYHHPVYWAPFIVAGR